MNDDEADRREAGFRAKTPLAAAVERLREAVEPIDRTDRVTLTGADGRVLAESVESGRDVPGYRRAAMDGFAVRAEDTFGATERSPVLLDLDPDAPDDTDPDRPDAVTLAPGQAKRVHTGSPVPEGADAVVMVEHVTERSGELEVTGPAAGGQHVAPPGEDVAAGEQLYEPGDRLGPADVGLLKAVGVDEVRVRARPTVGVIPTGNELVQRDPGPGEVVETNGLTVSEYVERWGGRATYRNVVGDDPDALGVAIQRDLTKDVVVTTGGSSVGERDLLPEVVDDLGEMLVHGVAISPGHPVGIGLVQETPVLVLPGYPVSTIVAAVQLLRPLLRWLEGVEPSPLPSTEATLDRKIRSEPGTRTFARVTVREEASHRVDGAGSEPGTGRVATPTRTAGAGVLSSAAQADGWVVVPEEREGAPEGETVDVQDWEWSP